MDEEVVPIQNEQATKPDLRVMHPSFEQAAVFAQRLADSDHLKLHMPGKPSDFCFGLLQVRVSIAH